MATRRGVKKLKIADQNYDKLTVNEVLCPICRSILIEPVSLPCSHVFCSHCFEETVQNTNLVCPLCRYRIASWLRTTRKQKKLINESYWNAIQKLFPIQIKNKLEGLEENLNFEQPIIRVATPGEIKKEYELQKKKIAEELLKEKQAEEKASSELIKKLQEEEEYQKSINEQKLKIDEELARKLAEEFQCPKPSPKENKVVRKKLGPIDKFLKHDNKTKTLGTNNNVESVTTDTEKSCSDKKSHLSNFSSNSDDIIESEYRYFKPIKPESKSVYKVTIVRPRKLYPKESIAKISSPKGKKTISLTVNTSAFATYYRLPKFLSELEENQFSTKKTNLEQRKVNSLKPIIKQKPISKKSNKKNRYQTNLLEIIKSSPKLSTNNSNVRISKRIGLRNKVFGANNSELVDLSEIHKKKPSPKKTPLKDTSPNVERMKSLRSNDHVIEVEIHRSASPLSGKKKSPNKKENHFSERLNSLRSKGSINEIIELSPIKKSAEKKKLRSSSKRSPTKKVQPDVDKINSLRSKSAKVACQIMESEINITETLKTKKSENMMNHVKENKGKVHEKSPVFHNGYANNNNQNIKNELKKTNNSTKHFISKNDNNIDKSDCDILILSSNNNDKNKDLQEITTVSKNKGGKTLSVVNGEQGINGIMNRLTDIKNVSTRLKLEEKRQLLQPEILNKKCDILDFSEDILKPNNVLLMDQAEKNTNVIESVNNRKRKLQEQLDYEFAKKIHQEELNKSYYSTRASIKQPSLDEIVKHVYK